MTPKPPPSPADRLRELHAKTTPGEWFTLRDGAYADVKARSDRAPDYPNAVASDIGRRDADFITAAHNDLPALLSDHARLVEEIGRLREAVTIMVSALDAYPPSNPDCSDWPSDPLGVLSEAIKNDFPAKACAALSNKEG